MFITYEYVLRDKKHRHSKIHDESILETSGTLLYASLEFVGREKKFYLKEIPLILYIYF